MKADIGIRDGRIVKACKAGNPDTMQGVDPELVVASTEVIAGENMIVTAGGIDSHPFHFAVADL